jgi:hypothetical protein
MDQVTIRPHRGAGTYTQPVVTDDRRAFGKVQAGQIFDGNLNPVEAHPGHFRHEFSQFSSRQRRSPDPCIHAKTHK